MPHLQYVPGFPAFCTNRCQGCLLEDLCDAILIISVKHCSTLVAVGPSALMKWPELFPDSLAWEATELVSVWWGSIVWVWLAPVLSVFTLTIQAQHLSVFAHIGWVDAKQMLTASAGTARMEESTWSSRPWITSIKTVIDDFRSNQLTLTETVNMAHFVGCAAGYEWHCEILWCKPKMFSCKD